jgi:hypothetical protein
MHTWIQKKTYMVIVEMNGRRWSFHFHEDEVVNCVHAHEGVSHFPEHEGVIQHSNFLE